MKIFMICPVRNATPEMREGIEAEVQALENQGHSVYYPARDTNQDDPTGLRICQDNRSAIQSADEVYVIWDGQSTGSLFDLGMAFASGKKIVPVVGRFPVMSKGKSFQNMVYDWQENGSGLTPIPADLAGRGVPSSLYCMDCPAFRQWFGVDRQAAE